MANLTDDKPAYVPNVGDIVRLQLWSPTDAPQREVKYGAPRIMLLRGIFENHRGKQGITRYWLANPKRTNDEGQMSWCESDWADLEHCPEEMGTLF